MRLQRELECWNGFRSFAVVPERVRTINVMPVSGGGEDSIPDVSESELRKQFGRIDASGFTFTVSANFSPVAITGGEVAPGLPRRRILVSATENGWFSQNLQVNVGK